MNIYIYQHTLWQSERKRFVFVLVFRGILFARAVEVFTCFHVPGFSFLCVCRFWRARAFGKAPALLRLLWGLFSPSRRGGQAPATRVLTLFR
ncbi:uncharacterized protein CYBJADRAFT_63179 [Cyberlindnera jadinii NRRL Y-1542]|uniref:Uncharacterized protein n=1 Tax=Cyberlindnera jadinii (strain ATCC 18201 / CBS 1600 / BCRC 20928 / JCM 3617 / NBRC 0987 / NRRL Y-1542) TaxID=983966 RepID=A0A1E4S5N2_CYBJN|nr:hypothetical protein CYBJADRAFT_63179 [Cyberlindnera jadinii NRRL Y-1542]ODV74836.1 hypothetical protein CYBJADRAFT_63179 [Cyberlindnera jadinii NRRL Y-1542]